MDAPFATILVADLVGSATLFEKVGDEAADVVRRERFAALRAAVAEHEGREVRATGEGLMVAFPSAVGAVRCAVAMQRTTAAEDGVELRIGLDAGEPLPDGGDLYGKPVVIATRLCEMAGAGEIVTSDVVSQLAGSRLDEAFRPLGPTRLRGIEQRVAAARVEWRESASQPAAATAGQRPISVVVADDERLIRAGFRVILDTEPDIEVVGEAADGRSALDVVTRRRPDVILMDIRMPELDGLEAAERILSDPGLDTAVIVLTTFDLQEYVYEALRIGASGFLLKDTPADRLLDAVRVVAAGDALLAPSITRGLIEQFARAARPEADTLPAALAELTTREVDVLRLVASGLSNAEIAAELVLGENTIKTHVGHILGKLGLRDRVQAVVIAYETGLVMPELRPGNTDGGAIL